MMSAVYCLTLLLGVFSVSATDIRLSVTNVNGLQAILSPDLGSIGVDRQLAASTIPGLSTPATPPALTPITPSSQLTSTSSVAPGNSSTTTIVSSTASPVPLPTSTIPPKFAGRVNVVLNSVRELDNNMSAVQTTPPNSFNSFASWGQAMFTSLSPPGTMTVPSSTPSVTANCQTVLNSNLYPVLNTTTFTVVACAMTENTTVLYGNETNLINAGQLGVLLTISSWPWSPSGAYIELNVTVAVPTGRNPSLTTRSSVAATKIGLGTSDAYALFSATVANNGINPSYIAMPANYPMLVPGSGTSSYMATVVLMLPKTDTSNIIWNAIIEPGYGAPQGSVSAAESVIASRMMIVQLITVMLAAILAGQV